MADGAICELAAMTLLVPRVEIVVAMQRGELRVGAAVAGTAYESTVPFGKAEQRGACKGCVRIRGEALVRRHTHDAR